MAKKTQGYFQKVETGISAGLQAVVVRLAKSEGVAFATANAGLSVAKANTKDIDIARSAIKFADTATDSVMDVGCWMLEHEMNILNIKTVELSGDLRGCVSKGVN